MFAVRSVIAFLLWMMLALPQASAQATVAFQADLAMVAKAPRSGFAAGGAEWTCTTTACYGKGPGNDPIATCKALMAQVGALKSFLAAGKALDITMCAATPALQSMRLKPSTPAPSPAAPSEAASSTPAAGATRAGIAFTTQAITLTGTGAAAGLSVFTPLAWTATSLVLTGTGVATPARAPVRISFTTDTIRLTGRP